MQIGFRDLVIALLMLLLIIAIALVGFGTLFYFSSCKNQVETKVVERCVPAQQQAEPKTVVKDCPPCPSTSCGKQISSAKVMGHVTHDEMHCFIKEKFPNSIMINIMSEDGYNVTSIGEIRRFMKEDNVNNLNLDLDEAVYGLTGRFKGNAGWAEIGFGHIKTKTQFANVAVTMESDGRLHAWTINPRNDDMEEQIEPYYEDGMCVNM